MIKLGKYPEERYSMSWMTQRLANRAPEYTHARKQPYSILQQILNPVAKDVERTIQQLTEERNNYFASSINMNLLDKLYYFKLGIGMKFKEVELIDGSIEQEAPTVYAKINDTEYEITPAEENNIETLMHTAIPSRIEDAETSYTYEEVIPRTFLSDLGDTTPSSISVPGHAIITIRNNTNWYVEVGIKVFYAKVFVRGETRQGTLLTESIPIRYNGTFKTIHQWVSIDEVWTSYMDDSAELTVETLGFEQDSFLDVKNVIVNTNGNESFRFLRLESKTWGTTLLSDGFTEPEIRNIQMGFDAKDTEYEIELLDEDENDLFLNGMAINNNFKWLLAIDNENLYVYNYDIPYPEVSKIQPESTNTKMDLYSDRFVFAKGDIATIQTKTLDVSSPPWMHRWTLEEPDGTKWYLGIDGSKWPLTTDAWIPNNSWDNALWTEQRLQLLLEEKGSYVITIECLYTDRNATGKQTILTTRHMIYVPSIKPEITLELPTQLKGSEDISFDDDGNVWLLKYGTVNKLNMFFDYFLTDFNNNTVLFREEYSSVRVVTE